MKLASAESETYARTGKYSASLRQVQMLAGIRDVSGEDLELNGAKYHLKLSGNDKEFLIVTTNDSGQRNFCYASSLNQLRFAEAEITDCAAGKHFVAENLCSKESENQWCRDHLLTSAHGLEVTAPSPSQLDTNSSRHPFADSLPKINGKANDGSPTGGVEILSDTRGIDFGPYLQKVMNFIKRNWYSAMPQEAKVPMLERGNVTIDFTILKNGDIDGIKLRESSQKASLDRAAWSGIAASNPFPPLPKEFSGEHLELRLHFEYNPDK